MSGLVEIDSHGLPEMSLGDELGDVEVAAVGILVDVDELAVLLEHEKDVAVKSGLGRRGRRVEAALGLPVGRLVTCSRCCVSCHGRNYGCNLLTAIR